MKRLICFLVTAMLLGGLLLPAAHGAESGALDVLEAIRQDPVGYLDGLDEVTEIWEAAEFQAFFETDYAPVILTDTFVPLCQDAYSEVLLHKLQNHADLTLLPGDIATHATYPGDDLSYARDVLDKAIVLGFLYRRTGKRDYAAYLERQLVQFSNDFAGFSPYPYLNTAEALTALSVGYVWLGEGMSQGARLNIKSVVKNKLDFALTMYEPDYTYFALSYDNWNAVCNGGVALAAMAFGDAYPALCGRLLNHALRAIRLSIAVTAPDGGTLEGPGYWQYEMQYLTYTLSTLDAVFGQSFGLTRVGALDKTGRYHMDMHSSDPAAFNFSDAGATKPQISFLYYLGKCFGQPELGAYADWVCPNGVDYASWEPKHGDVLALLWRTGEPASFSDLPTEALYRGPQPVRVARSGWYPGAAYFAMKGGNAQMPHGSMDAGTFVLDAMGERWAEDLGGEDYGGTGYWDFTDTGRWSYYSQRAEGHNTLVIDPGDHADQDNAVTAEFSDGHTLDFGGMYGAHAVTRSFAMTDAGHRVTLTDTIRPSGSADIYWFMHTKKQIAVDGNTAVLSAGGKRCVVTIQSPADAVFTQEALTPLVIANNPDAKPFADYQKLQIHYESSQPVTIQVSFAFENDQFLIEHAADGVIRFNRPVDWENSAVSVTDLHHNDVPVTVTQEDAYTLRLSLGYRYPGNVYFADLSGVRDTGGNPLAGETSCALWEPGPGGSSLYSNDFSDVPMGGSQGFEAIGTRSATEQDWLMVYDDKTAGARAESFYRTPLIEGDNTRVVLEAKVYLTRTGNEKKLFRLYDAEGQVTADSLVTLTPMTEDNDYQHVHVQLAGGTFLMDPQQPGERYQLAVRRPYQVAATLDLSAFPAQLTQVTVTDLVTGEAVSGTVDADIYQTFPFSVGLGQRVWGEDMTYFDDLSVHYEWSGIRAVSIQNGAQVSVVMENHEAPQTVCVYAAAYDADGRLTAVRLKKYTAPLGVSCITFENVAGENRRIYVWSEEGVPYA